MTKRRLSPREERIQKGIKVYQTLHDMTNAQMAAKMHMTEPTWKRKKGSPNQFSFAELEMLEDKIKLRIFARDEVAG